MWSVESVAVPRNILILSILVDTFISKMRKTYLKEYRPAMYSLYMLEDRLVEHLNLVDDEAQERRRIVILLHRKN